MKILVMSDSHKSSDTMLDVVAAETPGYILHLGDHERDCEPIRQQFPDIPLRAVRGNCDGFSQEIETDEFVLEDKRFFMTHGHLFGVKASASRVIDIAQARGADILLYGHTHIPDISTWMGMYVINPGSIGSSRGSSTYAVIEIEGGKVKCEIRRI